MPGTKPLAVNDTDAQVPLSRAIFDKVSESRFGLGNSHAVQIDLSLNAETASREFAHRATTNGWAMKAHAFRITAFHRVDVRIQAFAQCLFLIGTGEASLRFRLVRFSFHTKLGAQRFGSRYGTAEQAVIIIAQGWLLRLWRKVNIKYSERVPSSQSPPTSRMKILVSNDDGYLATGINVLTDALAEIADVVVVAPDFADSAIKKLTSYGEKVYKIGKITAGTGKVIMK